MPFPVRLTLLTLATSFCLASCAGVGVQPKVNSLVVAHKLDGALDALGENPKLYGRNNQLLYWLDRGMVLHSAGRYKESIAAFATAQRTHDELYTKSISKMASAWALNDYSAPYRGEDFEYVLTNIFQALNYAMLGDTEEALVEARDVDSKLNLINGLYAGKNVYKDDAFARLLSGILYEANGSSSDLNDAYISYARAFEGYSGDFGTNYGLEVPRVLKENLLTLARWMGQEEFEKYRDLLPDTPLVTIEDKRRKAEVYLVQYTGFSPVKVPSSILIPVDIRHVTQISFPEYNERFSEIASSEFSAAVRSGGVAYTQPSEVGHNLETLAVKVLESRKAAIMTKAVVRPAVKYAAERTIERQIEDDGARFAFNLLSTLFNLSTEQADLRSWQTLPGQIRISRLLLDPGEYEFFVQTYAQGPRALNKVSLGTFKVEAKDKRFLVFRNYR